MSLRTVHVLLTRTPEDDEALAFSGTSADELATRLRAQWNEAIRDARATYARHKATAQPQTREERQAEWRSWGLKG